MDRIDDIRDLDEGEVGTRIAELISEFDLSYEEQLNFASKVGEICTLTERLVRFPRSITLAGLTGNIVDDIYDIQSRKGS